LFKQSFSFVLLKTFIGRHLEEGAKRKFALSEEERSLAQLITFTDYSERVDVSMAI